MLIMSNFITFFLSAQVVNGPEVLSKFVGETEKNVRDLFADAEAEQKSRGNSLDVRYLVILLCTRGDSVYSFKLFK